MVTGLQGEFDIELESTFLPEETLSLTFHLENQTLEQPFRVRTAAEQKANLTETSIVTGQVPNDLEISSDKIWVLASADSLMQEFGTDHSGQQVITERTTYFPIDDENRGSNFYQFAFNFEKNIVAVSLFTQHAVAIVELSSLSIIDVFHFTELPLITLEESIVLSAPKDADNDGIAETSVSKMYPHYPQALVWQNDELWVGATNFLGFSSNGMPPQVAPGTLVHLNWNGNQLNYESQFQLQGYNPRIYIPPRPDCSC